jgi:diguanylate cyclase (GGDEF)-like protein/PAS domain S-box-containing protein
LDARLIYINPTLERLLGVSRAEARGERPTEADREIFRMLEERILAVAHTGNPEEMEMSLPQKDGSILIHHIRFVAEHNNADEIVGVLAIGRDITERKQMEEQVHQLAFFDPLTQLPNRRLFDDRLSQAMAVSQRSGCFCAVMYADLDNFKPLNDAHGHEAGDLLLIEVANRLKTCVREMDTVARVGGDEFVILVCELDTDKIESATQTRIVAEKIRIALALPYVLKILREGNTLTTVEHHCSVSIGVTLFVNHEADQASILDAADKAMYQAKEAGRNSIRNTYEITSPFHS